MIFVTLSVTAAGSRCRPSRSRVAGDAAMSDGAGMKSRHAAHNIGSRGHDAGRRMLLRRIGGRLASAQAREDEHRRRRVPGHRLGRTLHRAGPGPVRRPGPARDDRARPKNVPRPPPRTWSNGQVNGQYDITAGDYVTYIEDQLGIGAPKADLRIIAESSFLQPNVLTLLVKGGSPITSGQPAQGQGRLGQRAERHRHPAGRFPARLARPQATADALRQRAVPGRGVDPHEREEPGRRLVRPRAVRQRRRGGQKAWRNSPTSTRAQPRTSRSRATRSRRNGRRRTPTR